MKNKHSKSFGLLTLLFFMWGFITVSNDILINAFKDIFDLTPPQRSLIQFAFFGAFFFVSLIYFIISSSSGKDPINIIGYKASMSYSLILCGIGCILFYPAAAYSSYTGFLIALFVLASGVTLLQICANPYATILGDSSGASSRLNLAQGLNSLGTTIGPIVGIILIYKIFSTGSDEEVNIFAIAKTYVIYGAVFIALAILTMMSKLPTFTNNEKISSGFGVLKNRHLVLGILAIFFYVGSEVAVGSWIVEFIKLPNIRGMKEADASYFLSFFWGGLMIGRLVASISLNTELSNSKKIIRMTIVSFLMVAFLYLVTGVKYEEGHFVLETISWSEIQLYVVFVLINLVASISVFNKPARALVLFSTINVILLLCAILFEGEFAFWCIIGSGLFFSIGWSNIFSLAIKNLGKYTSQGSAMLVMAIAGGAVLPGIQSLIMDKYDVQISFIIPFLGILYLVYYGLRGHKVKST